MDRSVVRVFTIIVSIILFAVSQFVHIFKGSSPLVLAKVNLLFLLPLLASVLLLIGLIYLIIIEFRMYSRKKYYLTLTFIMGGLLVDINYIIFIISQHPLYIWKNPSIYLNIFGFILCFLGLLIITSSHNPDGEVN